MGTPFKGVSNSILTKTVNEYEGLRVGGIEIEDKRRSTVVKLIARYKPKDEGSSDNIDQWGFTKTDPIPALRLTVPDRMKLLAEAFVPFAVKKAGGFANFRKNATKTITLLDRLKKLTLPKLEDVEPGLEKYLEQKEKAEKLEDEIQQIDNQIDAIVFDLYDLNEEEVTTVLDSLETPKYEKSDILEKFRQVG